MRSAARCIGAPASNSRRRSISCPRTPGSKSPPSRMPALTGAGPRRSPDPDRRVSGLARLDRAGPHDLTFLDSSKYAQQAAATDAAACLATERLAHCVPEHVALLCVGEPYRAFVETARALYPDALRPSSLFEASAAAPGNHVHRTARVEAGVRI